MGLAADALAVAPRDVAGDACVLVLGCISDDPKTQLRAAQTAAGLRGAADARRRHHRGQVLMARDTQQMTSYLRRGRVDWVTETSGTGMQLQVRAGARPIAIAERGGASSNRSMFFVLRQDRQRRLETRGVELEVPVGDSPGRPAHRGAEALLRWQSRARVDRALDVHRRGRTERLDRETRSAGAPRRMRRSGGMGHPADGHEPLFVSVTFRRDSCAPATCRRWWPIPCAKPACLPRACTWS